jgi:hypothetical protein
MREKMFSCLFGVLASWSFTVGFFLLISNIQGSRVPDGHPLDPAWLVWGLLIVVPATLTLLAVGIWPKERKNKTIKFSDQRPKRCYQGKGNLLLF